MGSGAELWNGLFVIFSAHSMSANKYIGSFRVNQNAVIEVNAVVGLLDK